MYNFIIYTDGFNEIEDMLFGEASNRDNVYIVSKNSCIGNRILQCLFRFHYSFRINNKINLPLKRIWFPTLDRIFSNDDPTIYVFLTSWYYPEYFEYLRKKHPTCKLAFYFGDTVISKKRVIKNLDISYLKKIMDFVGSYNPKDVKEYGLSYLQMCYSKYPKINELPEKEKRDFIFIGAARSRMNLILRCYEQAKRDGVNYLFYVVNHDNTDIHIDDENFVLTNTPMEFADYLGYVMNSKCILEIVDSETDGGTLRFWDAIMYNKKIVTNNKSVLSSKFYNEDNVVCSKDFLNVDFKKIINNEIVDYHYDGENSPVRFLKTIADIVCGGKQ